MAKNLMQEIHWLKWENGKEWGKIFCPMLGEYVMTYYQEGTPAYDTYTAPFVDSDGESVCFYKYDQDEDCWHEELYVLGDYVEGVKCSFAH